MSMLKYDAKQTGKIMDRKLTELNSYGIMSAQSSVAYFDLLKPSIKTYIKCFADFNALFIVP